jgi:cell division transport system ATP-binding protein
VIRLEGVSKSYKTSTRPALAGVSVEMDKGEFVFLIGPSGSGKSTFLRLLLREEVPTRGRVYVSNFDVSRMARRRVPRLRQSIGCVFQDFRLLANKTVSENVAFALEVIGKPKNTIRKVVPEVLDLVGLEGKADRMPHELSGGEQQRVAIARAFVNRPLVLLADEPTGHQPGHHAAAGTDQPHRHNRADGDARPLHRGLDASPGGRAVPRQDHPGRCARCVRRRPLTKPVPRRSQ